ESGLEQQVQWGVRALFLANPNDVCAELRSFAEDSIHKTITRDALVEHLSGRGFKLRRLAKLDAAEPLVREITKRYLDSARKKLLRQSLLPRAATGTLVAKLGADAGDSVL